MPDHLHRPVERLPVAVPGHQEPGPATTRGHAGQLHQQHRGPRHQPVRRHPRGGGGARSTGRRPVRGVPEALHRHRDQQRSQRMTLPMHRTTHRGRAALATTLILAAGLLSVPAATASPDRAAAGPGPRLTNLAHLDFFAAEVTPPTQAGHTTYRLASQPRIGVLWTYADRNAEGSFRRLGGGTYDAATDTYGQGAFNADDISRAAVVYLRDWQQTGR